MFFRPPKTDPSRKSSARVRFSLRSSTASAAQETKTRDAIPARARGKTVRSQTAPGFTAVDTVGTGLSPEGSSSSGTGDPAGTSAEGSSSSVSGVSPSAGPDDSESGSCPGRSAAGGSMGGVSGSAGVRRAGSVGVMAVSFRSRFRSTLCAGGREHVLVREIS